MATDLHLKLTNVNRYLLTRSTYLKQILNHLALALDVTPTPLPWWVRFFDPYTISYPTPDGKLGYTIFLPIQESFLAVETWPENKRATLVIVSCKEFDEDHICDLVRQDFLYPKIEKLGG